MPFRIADLPSIEVLRSQLLGVLQAPATQLARVVNTPASMVARAIRLAWTRANK